MSLLPAVPELPAHGLDGPGGVPAVLEEGGVQQAVHQALDGVGAADGGGGAVAGAAAGHAAHQARQTGPEQVHGGTVGRGQGEGKGHYCLSNTPLENRIEQIERCCFEAVGKGDLVVVEPKRR